MTLNYCKYKIKKQKLKVTNIRFTIDAKNDFF